MAILLEAIMTREMVDTVECQSCGINFVPGDSTALGADKFCSKGCEAGKVERPSREALQLPASSVEKQQVPPSHD